MGLEIRTPINDHKCDEDTRIDWEAATNLEYHRIQSTGDGSYMLQISGDDCYYAEIHFCPFCGEHLN